MNRFSSRGRLPMVISLVLGTLLLSSAPLLARSWQVTKAGNGDYLVIQDAVDAAASGDTILIAAGRYDEFTWIQLGGILYYVDCPKSLTFIGAGVDFTKIGKEDPDFMAPQVRQEGIVCVGEELIIRCQGIGFENLRHGRGIFVSSGQLEVEHCSFTHSSNGIYAIVPQGAVIRNCSFTDIGLWPEGTSGEAIGFSQPTDGAMVENCGFVDCYIGIGSYWGATLNVDILNCNFMGGRAAIAFIDRASGSARKNRIEGQDSWGIVGSEAGTVLIEDNEIIANYPPGGATGFGNFFTGGNYTLRRNIISASNGNSCIDLNLPNITLNASDNHFLHSDDGSFFCEAQAEGGGPYYIDVRNNWWGTTDAQEISDGILDLNDDPDRRCEFVFEPFLDHPVSSELKSFGDFKAMFR